MGYHSGAAKRYEGSSRKQRQTFILLLESNDIALPQSREAGLALRANEYQEIGFEDL